MDSLKWNETLRNKIGKESSAGELTEIYTQSVDMRNSIHKIKRTKLKALYMLLCQSKKLPIVEFPRSGIMWERTPDRQRHSKRNRQSFAKTRLASCGYFQPT
ncbi:hypothetical protein M3Y98_00439800 [Aphelenchoides besseyi]|nr:hypothetical protein M3Y98_00439800 [Aphelenchoides besseyi]